MGIKMYRSGGTFTKVPFGQNRFADTRYRAERERDETSSDAAQFVMSPPTWANHFVHYNKAAPTDTTEIGRENEPAVGEQGTLFSRQPGEINHMYSAKNVRQAIPTLLGVAANDHDRMWMDKDPKPPTYSDDLSPYSSRLVQHLQEKGVDISNRRNPTAEETNDRGFEHTVMENSYTIRNDPGASQVSQEDRVAGLQRVRQVLRGPQFPQES